MLEILRAKRARTAGAPIHSPGGGSTCRNAAAARTAVRARRGVAVARQWRGNIRGAIRMIRAAEAAAGATRPEGAALPLENLQPRATRSPEPARARPVEVARRARPPRSQPALGTGPARARTARARTQRPLLASRQARAAAR